MAYKGFLVQLCTILVGFRSVSMSVDSFSHGNDESERELLLSRSYFGELSKLSKYKFTLKANDELTSANYFPHDALSRGKWQYELMEIFNLFNSLNNAQAEISLFNRFRLPSLLGRIEKKGLDINGEGSVLSSCVNDTGTVVTSLFSGETWAFQFLDATGKLSPSITKGWLNFVGSYDQCIEAKPTAEINQFHGNYFTLPLHTRGSPSITIKLGICFPSTCSSKQISVLFRELFSVANITKLQVGNVIESNAETNITAATVVAIIILVISGSLVIFGTYYDVIVMLNRNNLTLSLNNLEGNGRKDSHRSQGNNMLTLPSQNYSANETLPLISKAEITPSRPTYAVKILLAFSLYSNGKKVLNTSKVDGNIDCIKGVRFLSMTWVVLGHCYLFGGLNYTLNISTEYPILLHRWTFDAVMNALVSVDTFFTVSGLLTAYVTLQVLWRNGIKMNWAKFYFHRFWRLTPPYMCALVIFLGLQQYLGKGPFWFPEQPYDKINCERNWWTNLLYVNNIVNTGEMCFGHSWYLANDMQFFVISPIMLIPFYFHWVAGVTSCVCVLLISWITTYVLSYQNDWGPAILENIFAKNRWFQDYYIVPWCRIGPYVVGILAGYALAIFQRRPFRIRLWVIILGWLVAIGSALAVLYGIHGDITGEHRSSRVVAALYNTVSRSVWGACVCWVIVACAMGYGGPVNAFLSWSPFTVLGRLTYMTYLIHLNIIQVFFASMGSLYYMNDTIMPVMFLGLLVFCNMTAFVGVLLLESPMIGLEKVIFREQN